MLFSAYESALREAGFLAMGGQIVDATVVAAPKQLNTEGEKAYLKAGRVPESWRAQPARLARKDRGARWTIKWSKAKPAEDGAKRIDIAVPAFGYKNHVSINRRHGLIRTWMATDAARHDGAQLPGLLSKANEAHLAAHGFRSCIHRKKPPGKPMARNVARANRGKSKVRAAVEHVFARQKGPMGLVVRTIGLARARMKIGRANLAYNMNRVVWLTGSRTRAPEDRDRGAQSGSRRQ